MCAEAAHRFLAPFITGYLLERAFCACGPKAHIPVSSRELCCDGCEVSPCVQDLRHVTLHTFVFSRFPNMLLSPLDFSSR
jgi:hypothetical protein